MRITYLGHSCFSIDLGSNSILIDPFIRENPLAEHINTDSLKPSHIFLTHGHSDHVADAEYIARNAACPIIASFEIANWFEARGIHSIPMNIGGEMDLDFAKVKMVKAMHSSSLPDGSYGGEAAGFLIETSDGLIYHAGDTAVTQDMTFLKHFYGPIDGAILPIGDVFTMGVKDATLAAELIECENVIGCHYDTFPQIKIDKEAAKKLFEDSGRKLLLPAIGESVELPSVLV